MSQGAAVVLSNLATRHSELCEFPGLRLAGLHVGIFGRMLGSKTTRSLGEKSEAPWNWTDSRRMAGPFSYCCAMSPGSLPEPVQSCRKPRRQQVQSMGVGCLNQVRGPRCQRLIPLRPQTRYRQLAGCHRDSAHPPPVPDSTAFPPNPSRDNPGLERAIPRINTGFNIGTRHRLGAP